MGYYGLKYSEAYITQLLLVIKLGFIIPNFMCIGNTIFTFIIYSIACLYNGFMPNLFPENARKNPQVTCRQTSLGITS